MPTSSWNADAPLGDRKNTAFMGTVVTYGRGQGVVVSTGMGTQIGLIAEMLQSVEEEQTPLQKRLDQLGRSLGWAALAVCALVFVVGWMRGTPPLDMFIIAVSLAIAAVPEGLPAVVTISLALGMREMIKRHALIRRLSSVETLGSATVICSDKTGTLTQNEMTVTRVAADGEFITVTGSGYGLKGEFPAGWKTHPSNRLSRHPDHPLDRGAEQRCHPGTGNLPGWRINLPHGGRPHRRRPDRGRCKSRRPAHPLKPGLPAC